MPTRRTAFGGEDPADAQRRRAELAVGRLRHEDHLFAQAHIQLVGELPADHDLAVGAGGEGAAFDDGAVDEGDFPLGLRIDAQHQDALRLCRAADQRLRLHARRRAGDLWRSPQRSGHRIGIPDRQLGRVFTLGR